MVREVTSRESTALHVTMIVLVDMQLGPVNLLRDVINMEIYISFNLLINAGKCITQLKPDT